MKRPRPGSATRPQRCALGYVPCSGHRGASEVMCGEEDIPSQSSPWTAAGSEVVVADLQPLYVHVEISRDHVEVGARQLDSAVRWSGRHEAHQARLVALAGVDEEPPEPGSGDRRRRASGNGGRRGLPVGVPLPKVVVPSAATRESTRRFSSAGGSAGDAVSASIAAARSISRRSSSSAGSPSRSRPMRRTSDSPPRIPSARSAVASIMTRSVRRVRSPVRSRARFPPPHRLRRPDRRSRGIARARSATSSPRRWSARRSWSRSRAGAAAEIGLFQHESIAFGERGESGPRGAARAGFPKAEGWAEE